MLLFSLRTCVVAFVVIDVVAFVVDQCWWLLLLRLLWMRARAFVVDGVGFCCICGVVVVAVAVVAAVV